MLLGVRRILVQSSKQLAVRQYHLMLAAFFTRRATNYILASLTVAFSHKSPNSLYPPANPTPRISARLA